MTATLKEADCFGVILRSNDGAFTFVSAETGKVYATLDRGGLKVQRDRGKAKEVNVIPLKTLRVLLSALEKDIRA